LTIPPKKSVLPAMLRPVGLTPPERARWVLGFAKCNLDALTRAEQSALRSEVGAFLSPTAGENLIGALFRKAGRELPTIADLSEDEFRQAHSWLREGITLLSQEKAWDSSVDVGYFVLPVNQELIIGHYGDRSEQFKTLVFETLRETSIIDPQALLLCPNCKSLFVRRGRQLYCGPKCSQTSRTRRWRERHPEVARELRAAQYEHEVKASTGMVRPKIKRRPRR
jgi:hypothetical protein